MAEVITHWPGTRPTPAATFEYPWSQWGTLDSNGHGDIWLATKGIDFPATSSSLNFRGILYNRANRVTKIRKRDAPLVPKRVRIKSTGQEVVRRRPDYRPLRVKVQIVSEDLVAFQFYDSAEPPPEPEFLATAVPRKRRPLHKPVTRRTYELAGAH